MKNDLMSRLPQLVGRVNIDPETKKPYEGLRYITSPSGKNDGRYGVIDIWYKKGLLHNADGAAVVFKDGYSEKWINGNFIEVIAPAYADR